MEETTTIHAPVLDREDSQLIKPGQDASAMDKLMDQLEIPHEEDAPTQEDHKEEKPAKEDKPDKEEKPKEEPKGEQKPAEQPKPADTTGDTKPSEQEHKSSEKPVADEFEKEIEKVQLNKGASPKSGEALGVLKKKALEEHKKAQALSTELGTLKKQVEELSSKTVKPEQEEEYKKLKGFYEAFNLQDDPEFNEKHSKAIEAEQSAALELLGQWNLPKTAQDYIAKNGGIYEFSISDKLMPPTVTNEDGSRMTHAQWYSQNIEKAYTPAQKRVIDSRLFKIQAKIDERDQALRDAKSNRENFIKEREEKAKKANEDFGKRIMAHIPKVTKEIGGDIEMKQIPENATPEQKAAIEDHNKKFTEAQQIAKKYISDITPENLTEAAAWAAYGKVVARPRISELEKSLTESNKKIEELTQKIEGITKSGKLAKRVTTPGQPTTVARASDLGNSEKAMARLMESRK